MRPLLLVPSILFALPAIAGPADAAIPNGRHTCADVGPALDVHRGRRRWGVWRDAVLLAAGLFLVPATGTQAADGTLALTWDSCTGPIARSSVGPGTYSLFFSVQGIDQLHKAYDVRVIYGNAKQTVPDAWRFDLAGCQGSAFITMRHLPLPAASKVCPPFMQISAPSLQIKDIGFSPPSDVYAQTLMRVVLANSYPSGVPSVNPNQRYFLAEFDFDHSYSVPGTSGSPDSCGGFEQDITFMVSGGNYLDLNGITHPFNHPNPMTATFSAVVPARATTWGQIKHQYR